MAKGGIRANLTMQLMLVLILLYLLCGASLALAGLGTRLYEEQELSRGHDHELIIESARSGVASGDGVLLCLLVRQHAYPRCAFSSGDERNVAVFLSAERLKSVEMDEGALPREIPAVVLKQIEATTPCAAQATTSRVLDFRTGPLQQSFGSLDLEAQELQAYDLIAAKGYPDPDVAIYLPEARNGYSVARLEFEPVLTPHDVPWYRWVAATVVDVVTSPLRLLAGIIGMSFS